jgi:hypothetical protein
MNKQFEVQIDSFCRFAPIDTQEIRRDQFVVCNAMIAAS